MLVGEREQAFFDLPGQLCQQFNLQGREAVEAIHYQQPNVAWIAVGPFNMRRFFSFLTAPLVEKPLSIEHGRQLSRDNGLYRLSRTELLLLDARKALGLRRRSTC